MSSLMHRPPTKSIKPETPISKSTGTSYWRDTATTLSHENTTLADRVSQTESENEKLKQIAACAAAKRKELEQSLNEANKELVHLSTSHAAALRSPTQTKMTTVPASTQGRDAVYWHLTCRSMEVQYIQLVSELEARVKELTETKRKRM
jgi:hypothetical protein